MATTSHILVGPAKIKGIQQGAGTAQINIAGTVYNVGASVNLESLDFAPESKIDKFATTDGTRIESAIASQRVRGLTVTLLPMGAASTNASDALNVANNFVNLAPLSKVVLSNFVPSVVNGNYCYMEGGRLGQTREGVMIFSGLRLEQYETATSGTFDALT